MSRGQAGARLRLHRGNGLTPKTQVRCRVLHANGKGRFPGAIGIVQLDVPGRNLPVRVDRSAPLVFPVGRAHYFALNLTGSGAG